MRRMRLFRSVRLLAALSRGFGIASCVALAAADGLTETIEEVAREGEKVTLVADVDGGAAPFVYQWYKNGAPMADARGASLRFDGVETGDAGAYAVVVSNAGGSAASLPIYLIVTPGQRSRLANVSVLAATNDQVVVDFRLGGEEASGTTPVLVRAAGPGLAQFGVGAALTDPVLKVWADERPIASNDDWGGGAILVQAGALVGAYPFRATSKDSAVALDLPAAKYRAQVADAAGGAGVTMVEIYDTGSGPRDAAPRLVSISALGQVGPGAAKLVAGFTIAGDTSMKVLLRGVGPGLTRLGIAGGLESPRITLVRDSTFIAMNENWTEGGTQMVEATTAVGAWGFSPDARDSALVATLKPGSYTAQVSAASTGGSGLARIEVYEVP